MEWKDRQREKQQQRRRKEASGKDSEAQTASEAEGIQPLLIAVEELTDTFSKRSTRTDHNSK